MDKAATAAPPTHSLLVMADLAAPILYRTGICEQSDVVRQVSGPISLGNPRKELKNAGDPIGTCSRLVHCNTDVIMASASEQQYCTGRERLRGCNAPGATRNTIQGYRWIRYRSPDGWKTCGCLKTLVFFHTGSNLLQY